MTLREISVYALKKNSFQLTPLAIDRTQSGVPYINYLLPEKRYQDLSGAAFHFPGDAMLICLPVEKKRKLCDTPETVSIAAAGAAGRNPAGRDANVGDGTLKDSDM